jgi:hypothetical protein
LFTDNASRIKYLGTTARYWWLRSPNPNASNANNSYNVSPAGVLDNNNAYNANAAVPDCVKVRLSRLSRKLHITHKGILTLLCGAKRSRADGNVRPPKGGDAGCCDSTAISYGRKGH